MVNPSSVLRKGRSVISRLHQHQYFYYYKGKVFTSACPSLSDLLNGFLKTGLSPSCFCVGIKSEEQDQVLLRFVIELLEYKGSGGGKVRSRMSQFLSWNEIPHPRNVPLSLKYIRVKPDIIAFFSMPKKWTKRKGIL